MKTKILHVLVLSMLCLTGYSQNISINGPSTTCPNEAVTYHVFAKNFIGAKLKGSISWEVFIDGVYIEEFSQPVASCSGRNNNFYIEISQIDPFGNTLPGWREAGEVELRVQFVKSSLNPFCNSVSKSKFITSRAIDPGLPSTASGELTFCPGETKEVYLDPGYPGPDLDAFCRYHYDWIWTVPQGWKVTSIGNSGTGNSTTFTTQSGKVKVTAPAQIPNGTHSISVVSQDADFANWIGTVSRDINIGLESDIDITGPSTLCSSNSTYELSYLPSGASVAWSVSPTNLFAADFGLGSSFVTRATNSYVKGYGTITASITSSCGNTTVSRSVWVGKPESLQGDIAGPTTISSGASVYYHFNEQSPLAVGRYDWILPYNSGSCQNCWQTISGGDGRDYLQARVGEHNGYVQVRKSNACGNGGAKLLYVTINSGGGCLVCPVPEIATNPTKESIRISHKKSDNGEIIRSSEFNYNVEYMLLDMSGQTINSWSSKSTEEHLGLKEANQPGVYLLKIKYGNKGVKTERIIIEN